MSCWYSCFVSDIGHKKIAEFTKFQNRSILEEKNVKELGGYIITQEDEPAFTLCEELQELRYKMAQMEHLYSDT